MKPLAVFFGALGALLAAIALTWHKPTVVDHRDDATELALLRDMALDAQNQECSPQANPRLNFARPRPPLFFEADHQVEHLVFEGGGARALSYLGALQTLEDLPHSTFLLDKIHSVAGSSAGSVIALGTAVGCKPHSLLNTIRVHFRRLQREDFDWSFPESVVRWPRRVYSMINHGSVNDGDTLMQVTQDIVRCGGLPANATFGDLYQQRGITLVVTATELSTLKVRYFSPTTSPDVALADAVVASQSIPFVFAPKRIGRQLYIDGGIGHQFPLALFDGSIESHTIEDRRTHPSTLGFLLVDSDVEVVDFDSTQVTLKPKEPPAHLPSDSTWMGASDVLGQLVNLWQGSLENMQAQALYPSAEALWRRTLVMEAGEYESFDFALDDDKLNAIVQLGARSVLAQLQDTSVSSARCRDRLNPKNGR
ncbi:MAG: hypothetical protein MHM6MM_002454 [Cercozoa sp. M6MM]